MDILQALATSGMVGIRIAVPILRFIASVLFAIAISKDCRSRQNGSSALWGLLIFLEPVFFGIVYFVYSRFFTERKPETMKDKRLSHQSKVLCILAGFSYLTMLVVMAVSIIISVSSGIAVTINS